jgi:peptidylprolyl isomerase
MLALGLSSALLLLGACGGNKGGATSSASTSVSPAASASTSGKASPSASAVKVPVSTNLDKITVSGDYGKAPAVTVKAPWAINKAQTKVLKASNGAQVKPGQTVEVNYYALNGRTGKKFDDSFARGQTAAIDLNQVVPGFKKGLVGQKQGSRVLVAMPGSDGYDAAGGNAQIGIKMGDSLIFVVDLVTVQLPGPEGANVPPRAGLPTVTGKVRAPVIQVPKSTPPATLQVEPLIRGTGKKVTASDTITIDYRWVAWNDGRLLEETYSSKPATAPLSELLPGIQAGLVNQTVGSRVLLVIPPAQGYPAGNAKPRIAPGETMVMVVDLLFAQSGQ